MVTCLFTLSFQKHFWSAVCLHFAVSYGVCLQIYFFISRLFVKRNKLSAAFFKPFVWSLSSWKPAFFSANLCFMGRCVLRGDGIIDFRRHTSPYKVGLFGGIYWSAILANSTKWAPIEADTDPLSSPHCTQDWINEQKLKMDFFHAENEYLWYYSEERNLLQTSLIHFPLGNQYIWELMETLPSGARGSFIGLICTPPGPASTVWCKKIHLDSLKKKDFIVGSQGFFDSWKSSKGYYWVLKSPESSQKGPKRS